MKKLVFIYVTVLSFSIQAQTKFEYLNINNIAVGFNSDGTLFMTNKIDTIDVNGVIRTFSRNFNVPKNSTTNSIFASNLWIAGIDDGGNLYTAANTYRQSGTDFWAGPIANQYPSSNPDVLPKQGSKHPWKVYQNYVKDVMALKWSGVDDKYLEYK